MCEQGRISMRPYVCSAIEDLTRFGLDVFAMSRADKIFNCPYAAREDESTRGLNF